jgi:lysyl-tRNA synthetase class 2
LDWQPTSQIEALQRRADTLKTIRAFFARKGVLEVETPYLSRAANTDPYIDSLDAWYQATTSSGKEKRYLHTSPEFPMKRLLASGCGSIFQICKVFRQGESGRLHNPEFTMLEWYRPDMHYRALMEEVAELVQCVLPVEYQVTSCEYISYRDAFERYAGINPFTASAEALIECAHHGVGDVPGLLADDRDAWLSLLLTHLVEPHLGTGKLTFLYDFPISQASLANVRQDNPPVAERFELYINGIELANGFQELTDAQIQRERFEQDLLVRQKKGLANVPIDENMLDALEDGLPDCSGVALGIDRLCMIIMGVSDINQVITFPFERA